MKFLNAVNAVIGYFDLYSNRRLRIATAIAGDKADVPSNGWLVGQFIAVFLGVLAKVFMDYYQVRPESPLGFPWVSLIVSLIITAVIFPAVYKQTLEKSDLPNFVQWFIALGGGFGYKALIDIGGSG